MTIIKSWAFRCLTTPLFSVSSGIGKKQIGHSPKQLPSGCVNNFFSCNSFTRCLHSSLCCSRCSCLYLSPQYFTRSHPSQSSNNFTSSSPATPQLAHTTSASAPLLLIILLTKVLIIPESIPKDTCWWRWAKATTQQNSGQSNKQSSKNDASFFHRFSLRYRS